ncbi:DUF3300 domain-containing protein [Paraburkholderia sp. SIMBA_030]|uniref:DUF3300 domain-containing protein n=1 Tax=Paraburkholderia sp. SIMBA_030 TaxID=3085773 RepID=UPI003978D977
MKYKLVRAAIGDRARVVAASGVYGESEVQPAPQAAAPLTAEQLDQMLAPIALYPDPLVAQILMAATYPLEVVEADRWVQQPGNAALQGGQLTGALEQQPWEPSVKSLVPFPQVLKMLDDNLEWTERIGDAFLASQPAVMDSIQRLRQRAQAAPRAQETLSPQVPHVQAPQVLRAPPAQMPHPMPRPAAVVILHVAPGFAPSGRGPGTQAPAMPGRVSSMPAPVLRPVGGVARPATSDGARTH